MSAVRPLPPTTVPTPGVFSRVLAAFGLGRPATAATDDAPLSRPQALDRTPVSPRRRDDVQPIESSVVALRRHLNADDGSATLRQKSHVDTLTGLWNHEHLDALADAVAGPEAGLDTELCVLRIGLDGFEALAAKYGHGAAEQALVQIAKRLRQVARNEDAVFRLGEDDFMLLLTCPVGEGTALARQMAQRVVGDLQRPMSYRTLSNLRVGCSVGAGVWPVDGSVLADVVSHAGEALVAARRAGRGQYRQWAEAPSPLMAALAATEAA